MAGGIYRYNFSKADCHNELGPFFQNIDIRPIQIYLPILRRISWPSNYVVSRNLERIPFLRNFYSLLLCVGVNPVMAIKG